MKRLVLILMVVILAISFSGCTEDDLAAYLKAMDMSDEVTSGKDRLELELEIDYNKSGLTSDELRSLSYFDVVRFIMESQYDINETGEHVASNVYYNLGGMGLDMKFYVDGDDMYMKMPVRDEYMDMSGQLQGNETSEDSDQFMDIIGPILETWQEVLRQEDIIKGQNTYILTEQGQIKATTYDIEVNKDQLQILSDALFNEIKEKDLMELILNDEEELTSEEIDEVAENFRILLEGADIVYFNSTAFVDFDGRMIRQTFDFEIDFGDVESGSMSYVTGSLTTEKTELNESQNIDYPFIEDNQWVDLEDDGTYYEDLFPEGLFED